MNPSTTTKFLMAIIFVLTSPSVAVGTRYDLAPEQEGHTLQHEILDTSPSSRTIPNNDQKFQSPIQVVTQSNGQDKLPPLDGRFQSNLDTEIAASAETTYKDVKQKTAPMAVPRNNLRGPQSSNIQVVKQAPQVPVEGSLPLNGDFQDNLETEIAASFYNAQQGAMVSSMDLHGPESYQRIDSGVGCGLRCHLRRRA